LFIDDCFVSLVSENKTIHGIIYRCRNFYYVYWEGLLKYCYFLNVLKYTYIAGYILTRCYIQHHETSFYANAYSFGMSVLPGRM
jgi:hypothetical protein